MWNRVISVCLGTLAFAGCSDGSGNTSDPTLTASAGSNATSGAPAVAGTTAGMQPIAAGQTSPPPAGASAPSPGPLAGAAPAGAPAKAGSSAAGADAALGGSGGAVATAGSAGAAGSTAEPGAPGTPKIPEPKGECPKFSNGTMMIAGLRAQIQAGTPGDTKGALLFAWHATAGTAGAAMAGVPASVRGEITMGGGIVIAAQGNVSGSGRTDIAPPTAAWFVQDLDFADEVVACAVKNHNIDPNRIHATGCSAGGLMSGTFGLMRSQYVASVAPNSGGINYMGSRKLSDMSHGPAAFLMHGGSGDNVIVNFGETSGWFEAQNKLAANKPFMIDCNHSRGHCGAPSSLHELAWQFMKAHPYDVGASPWAMSTPMGLPDYCKVVP